MLGIAGNRSGAAALALSLFAALISTAAAAAPSPESNPFAPTLDQVNARFGRIQQEVDRLRAAGQTADADRMAADLQHFRDQLAGTAPSRGTGPQLSVVGTYDPGTVNVNVQPTDRPLILALTSYHQVNWNLNLQPGANLQKVLLYSYEKPIPPANLPKNVPVEVVDSYFAYGKDYSHYPNLARRLLDITGVPLSTMQGRYNFEDKTPPVDVGGGEWNAQRVLTEMQPLYNQATAHEMAQRREAANTHRFSALYHTADNEGRMRETFVAEFTPTRAISKTVVPVGSRLRHVTVNPDGPVFYGLAHGSGPVRIDRATGEYTDLTMDQELSHPTGLTYDTKRDRLILSTLGGEGWLLSYSEQDDAWSQLASLDNVDIHSITYSENDDAFYALQRGGSIVRYTPEGDPAGQLNLSGDYIPQDTYGPWDYQLIATDDMLVLLTSPMPDLYEPHLDRQMWSFLIDPDTGVVQALGGVVLAPEPGAATLLAGLCAAGLLRRRRR